jgi:hypothetical protein
VGPRAILDRCGKSRLTGIRSPDRPARSQSLYRLRYTAHICNYPTAVEEKSMEQQKEYNLRYLLAEVRTT